MSQTEQPKARLSAEHLRPVIKADSLGFETTQSLTPFEGLLGQDRALDAIRLAAEVGHKGFNLYVLGPEGAGRHAAVNHLLEAEAAKRPPPDDWIYVNNFEQEHKPHMMRLPPGMAHAFRSAMEALIDDLANDIPALFESDEYQTQRRTIEEEYGEAHEEKMADFAERARAQNIALVRTPMGFMLTAIRDGQPLSPQDVQEMEEDDRRDIEEKIGKLQQELAEILREAPKIEKAHRKAVEALNAGMAERVVSDRVADLTETFGDQAAIAEYLAALRTDIIDNAELFLMVRAQEGQGPFPEAIRQHHRERAFDRYKVNVMVSREQGETGAPVIHEDLPSFDHLTGRIEHISEMGALLTNFTMIKPGALHRANGGYLVLDARDVLREPLAWDALKRCLKAGSITITTVAERMGFASTTQLEPDPIPLDVRVVLVGDRMLHALLVHLDPDFSELFKLQADFDEDMDRDSETIADYARSIATVAQKEDLLPIAAAGMARLIEESVRLADDSTKLTLRLGQLADILREADHYARTDGQDTISADEVARAIDAQEGRASRVRDRIRESIERGILTIATEGEAVGQINGLSVASLNGFRFGRPSRITARVRMGSGKLVDIEREVELGGPLHSKGVMILSGYLTASFAPDAPFSLHASLVFEQSYGGIDGDSASSAELYALLSALAEVPIRQGYAVTGSVNQFGEVQAIGGVNEKIEGFFATCKARGLTGDQAVLIPRSNVEHLCLRHEVVDAVRQGQFGVIAVGTIAEGIEILTGVTAGERGTDGTYPEGTINARVEARLRAFAETRKAFVRKPGTDDEAPA